MIKLENETGYLLLLITKNCETLIHQTVTRPEETHAFNIDNPRETFHFNPPIQNDGAGMIGSITLEVYNSFFNITEKK